MHPLLAKVKPEPIHHHLSIGNAQPRSYMKMLNAPLKLLFNFCEVKLVGGISRPVLKAADSSPWWK